MEIRVLLAILLALSLAACSRDKPSRPSRDEPTPKDECAEEAPPDTLVTGGYDEKEMDAAIARARAEVDTFIGILRRHEGYDFNVKAPITDKGRVEHFWVVDVTYTNGMFEGTLDNEPGVVTNVLPGQKWRIAKGEISDWSFKRGGKLHGNYTMRPLLKTMSKEEADMYRSMLADP